MSKIERAGWQLAYCNFAVYLIACAMTMALGTVEATALIG
jgi:hypothetical protein